MFCLLVAMMGLIVNAFVKLPIASRSIRHMSLRMASSAPNRFNFYAITENDLGSMLEVKLAALIVEKYDCNCVYCSNQFILLISSSAGVGTTQVSGEADSRMGLRQRSDQL